MFLFHTMGSETVSPRSKMNFINNNNNNNQNLSHNSRKRPWTTSSKSLFTIILRIVYCSVINLSSMILYVILGFCFGLVVLLVIRPILIMEPMPLLSSSTSTTTSTIHSHQATMNSSSKATTITEMVIEQAEQKAQQEQKYKNQCSIPPDTNIIRIHIALTQESFQLVIRNNDDFLSNHIQQKGYWEIRTITEMEELSPSRTIPKPNMKTNTNTTTNNVVFYDIGANIGYYSFFMASYGYTVIAFEPEISNILLFRASLCINSGTTDSNIASRITLYEYAISNINYNIIPTSIPTTTTTTITTTSGIECKLLGTINQRTKKYLYLIPRISCTDTSKQQLPYQCNSNKDIICQSNIIITTLPYFVNVLHPTVSLPNIIKMDTEGQEYNIIENMFDTSALAVMKQHRMTSTSTRIRKLEPTIIQYENKDNRVSSQIASILSINGYTIGTKHGHDHNTIAEYQPLKVVRRRLSAM